MVGLNKVNNASDAEKIISDLTQTALNAKAPLLSPAFTGTVTGITQAMVGLDQVNNTSDANKIISTLTQTALNAKVDLSGNNIWTGTNTFNTYLPTSSQTPTTSNQLITKAYCDLKAPLESPTFSGNVTATSFVSSRDITVSGITVGNGGTSYLADSRNTCFGKATLSNYINTTDPNCCAVGTYVLANCTTGVSNTAISNYSALSTNISGSSNTAVGNRALEKSLSSFNTGLGDSAG